MITIKLDLNLEVHQDGELITGQGVSNAELTIEEAFAVITEYMQELNKARYLRDGNDLELLSKTL